MRASIINFIGEYFYYSRPPCKVAAMHDLCAYGSCSLTVVIPILSILNCQVSPLPTAFFSSHLGYPETCIFDLKNGLSNILKHWISLNLSFDCFYSGYIYSPFQMVIAKEFINKFKPKLIFIDPVLGDNGSLYKGTNIEHVDAMRSLISCADTISPNITEVCLLLNERMIECLNEDQALEFLFRLKKLGPSRICITGVSDPHRADLIFNYACDNDKFYVIYHPRVPRVLGGTGDCFSSILVGLLLQSVPWDRALTRAATFVGKALNFSHKYSVNLCIEPILMSLILEQNDDEEVVFIKKL